MPPGDCPERHHQRIVAHRHFSIANVPRIFRVPLQRAFAQSEMSVQYRLVIDLGDLLRADPEARWQSWQRARAAGVLSPNDVRLEEGWPASDDPTASSIEPPVAGGRAANGDDAGSPSASPGEPASPSEDEDESGKVARLDQRRSRHGSD